MTPRKITYRKFLGPWGLFVELTASAEPMDPDSKGSVSITEHVQLQVAAPTVTPQEVHYLELGLRLLAPSIYRANGRDVLIRVSNLDYLPTDYQPEAAGLAIMKWAAAEFDVPFPDVQISFDRATGYCVTWPEIH